MGSSGREIDYNPSVVIDGQVFNIALLMPSKSFEYAAKLLRLVGEPLSALAMSGNQDNFKSVLPTAVRSLTANLDNKETLQLVLTLFKTVSIDGKMINFEDYFHGRMGLMFKVLVALIETQFADFFQGVVDSLKNITDLVKA